MQHTDEEGIRITFKSYVSDAQCQNKLADSQCLIILTDMSDMETYTQQHVVVLFNTNFQYNLFNLTAFTGVFDRSTLISL